MKRSCGTQSEVSESYRHWYLQNFGEVGCKVWIIRPPGAAARSESLGAQNRPFSIPASTCRSKHGLISKALTEVPNAFVDAHSARRTMRRDRSRVREVVVEID